MPVLYTKDIQTTRKKDIQTTRPNNNMNNFSGKPKYQLTPDMLQKIRANSYSSSIDSGAKRYVHEFFHPGCWKNRPVYIIGGGPSLKNFDWDRLRGEIVISVNHKPLLDLPVTTPSMIVSMDGRAHKWVIKGQLGDDLLQKYNQFNGYKVYLDIVNFLEHDIIYAHNLGRLEFPENIADGVGNGNNSGYIAINLAYQLKADPIYLLGFDCLPGAGGIQSHYHGGYPVSQSDQIYKKFIQSFNYAASNIDDSRKIINLNPSSAIECFDKSTIEKVKRDEKPIICSFYTKEYRDYANRLLRSCHLFGLEYDIQEIESFGTWELNCQYKAKFLLEMIQKHKRDVVWIDADGIIQQFPHEFINFKYDFGCHVRNDSELLSGTLYFKNSTISKEILLDWIKENQSNPTKWDQLTLDTVLKTKTNIPFHQFPATYCQIYDLMAGVGDPVIEHFQASRQNKSIVNTPKDVVKGNVTSYIGDSYGIRTTLKDMGLTVKNIGFDSLSETIAKSQNSIVWGGYRHKIYEKGNNLLYLEGGIITPNTYYIDDKGFHSRSSIVTDKEFFNTEFPYIELENFYNKDGHILVCLQGTEYNTLLDEFYSPDSDYYDGFLAACKAYLPKGKEIFIRTHPLKRDEYLNRLLNSGIWRKDWKVNTSGTIDDMLVNCSAVVTINSTVHALALSKSIPVATLGRGTFTSSNVTLECSEDHTKLKHILKVSIDEKKVRQYLNAIKQHEVKRDWSDLKDNTYFKRWLKNTSTESNAGIKSIESPIKRHIRPLQNKVSQKGLKLVSIMMPAFNAEKFIAEAIESVLNQSYQNFELIIVNDASTDNTGNTVFDFSQTDNRIKVITHKENLGEAAARNTAIEFSNGDYIAKLDADDYWTPDFLEKTIDFLEKNPTFDVVSTDMNWNQGRKKMYRYNAKNGMIPDGYMGLKQGCNPINASIVAHSAVYNDLKFDPNIILGCDGEWNIRACVNGIRYGFIPEPLYNYRKHPGGAVYTRESSAKTTQDNLQRIVKSRTAWDNAEWRYAELFVITKCNMKCPLCSQDNFMKNNPNYQMTLKEVREFISRTKELNVKYEEVRITGGEPALHRNLNRILELIRESGITNKIMLFSNGLKLKDSTIGLCDKVLISKRSQNKLAAEKFKNQFGDKIIAQTSTHKKLPCSPYSKADVLPALCNCRGYQLRNRIMYICPNAGDHLQRIYKNSLHDFQIGIDQDWIKYFRSIDRYNIPLCQVCLGNRKVWNKI